MKKPTSTKKEVYDFLSIAEFVNEKYNLGLDSTTMWHWFVDAYEVDNGSCISFDVKIEPEDKEWVKKLKKHLKDEFGEDIELLVEW